MSERPVIPMGQGSGPSERKPTSLPFTNTPRLSQAPLLAKSSNKIWIFSTRLVSVLRKSPSFAISILTLLLLVLIPILVSLNASSPSTNETTVSSIPGKLAPPLMTPPSSLNDVVVTSIVSIVVYDGGKPCAGGSGSVVGNGSLVLTNNHVVQSDKRCTIDEIRVQTVADPAQLPRDNFKGTVIAVDIEADLAILSLEPMTRNPPTLRPLELSTNQSIGDDITVLGFPAVAGDSVTISKGIISGYLSIEGLQWMKTDAALSGGNSGGAALDSLFRLVAVPSQFSQSLDGNITDCRVSADTNGDGVIDDDDSCVGVGGTFTLMATTETILRFALENGINLTGFGTIDDDVGTRENS